MGLGLGLGVGVGVKVRVRVRVSVALFGMNTTLALTSQMILWPISPVNLP